MTKGCLRELLELCARHRVTRVVFADGSYTPLQEGEEETHVGWGLWWGEAVTGGRMKGGDNFDAELEAMLTRSAYRDWVAKARSEQQTLVRTIMGAALFVGLGVLALLISHALPSSGSSAGRDDGTAWYTLMWLGTFIGRIALGLILLVLLVLIGPVALAMSVAGLGKLCGWFFDLCELLFSRVLTPLLEDYVLKPRVATTRSHPAQGGNVRRRRGHR